jgi:hypothetical protein
MARRPATCISSKAKPRKFNLESLSFPPGLLGGNDAAYPIGRKQSALSERKEEHR